MKKKKKKGYDFPMFVHELFEGDCLKYVKTRINKRGKMASLGSVWFKDGKGIHYPINFIEFDENENLILTTWNNRDKK